jgi:hypothetical protein
VKLYSSIHVTNYHVCIEPYFLPTYGKHGIIEIPLPAHDCLTIGYGSSGTPGYSYLVREGQDVDVGALKVFLSTDYVDYGRIAQRSPFENPKDYRGTRAEDNTSSKGGSWDTMTVAIVQRKRHSLIL